ncbi:MAG: hypothetical protein AB8G05_26140 [Oligoflexales bacterium]
MKFIASHLLNNLFFIDFKKKLITCSIALVFLISLFNTQTLASEQDVQKYPFNKLQIKILQESLLKRTKGMISVEDILGNWEEFKNYVLSDSYQLAYYLALANPPLYKLCKTDDLLTRNGGNSWRKGGAVKVSEFLKYIDLELQESRG